MKYIDLQQQYLTSHQRIDGRIAGVLKHGHFIGGPEVTELEEQLADYVGVEHAISCGNGTDALQLCLMTLNLSKEDAVFCPTFTFFASAEVIGLVGATPIFIDSQIENFNLCCDDLERKILHTLKEGLLTPRAIIAVDLFGLPADYNKLTTIANKYGLTLIEDAAQGFGGSIGSKRTGSFSNLATTSFFPAKPLGCYGDGGAIFTNDNGLAELLRSLREHGKGTSKYDNVRVGMNSRLDTIQAAILLEKLAIFPDELISRNEIAEFYLSSLADANNLQLPKVPEGYSSSWAQFSICSQDRDYLRSELEKQGIPTMVYYPKCMHQLEVFKSIAIAEFDCPNAEKFSEEVFSIPFHPYLKMDEMKVVVDALREI